MYEGELKDGKRHGQGTISSPGLGKYVGELKYNRLWNGTNYFPNGKIMSEVVNGKWINP